MLTTTQELVAAAHQRGGAVAAFNIITLEHAEGVAEGAVRAGLPAILQISQNAVRYHGGDLRPLAAACIAVAEAATVPLSLHLDHVEDEELLRAAAAVGASSVMFDAARLPYAENLARTRAAADWAHGAGLYVEAELGAIGGKDGAHAPGARTDPDEAREFVTATRVDALAVAIGSSHAMTERTGRLDLDLLDRLRDAVAVPLVLHGSSGVADDTLHAAIRRGIVKVNVGTLLNVAFTGAVREALPDISVDPRPYLRQARAAVAAVVEHLLVVTNTGAVATPGGSTGEHRSRPAAR